MAEAAKKPEPEAPADDVAALKAELAELRSRTDVYEKTLKALQPPERSNTPEPEQQYTYQPTPIPDVVVQRIKNRLGWDDQTVKNHWDIIGTYLTEIGQPIVQAIGTLADQTDYVKTRITKSDYADIEADVEAEYKARSRAGRPASRAELYEVIKARKLPELVARETERKLAEEKQRVAQTRAAETEGASSGGQAKPGDNVMKSGRELTAEEFGRLSLEDKEAYLDGKTF